MAKSFVAGAMIGAVVSVVGAGTLSLVIGPPARTMPDMGDAKTEIAPVDTPQPEVAPEPEIVEEAAPVDPPIAEAPDPVVVQAPEPVPESAPEPAPAPDLPPEPVMAAPQPVDTVDPAPVTESTTQPQPMAPPEPIKDAQADSGAPERDMAAPAVDSAGPETPIAPAPSDVAGAPAITETALTERAGATIAPAAPGDEPTPELSMATPTPPLPAPVPQPPQQSDRTAGLPIIGAPEDDAVVPETPAPPAQDAATNVPVVTSLPGIGAPAGSLLDRDGAVPKRRLPSVGGTTEALGEVATGDLPPLERYAAAVNVPEGEPMMSVVLIDDGSGPLGPETVGELPFPVSFAISPSHPDARATAQAYRAAGFEVLALAGVPGGAQASDVEISLEGALGGVPEAIGVLEDPANGLQGSRSVSEQAAEFLRDSGHGLLMLPKGLGTGEALAQRVGVPTATVFRDFDGSGQDPRVMRRFLDQAAFRARQEGAVVMLGRLRADTVSALLLWGLQDRASSIALVPVSAILKRDGAPG